jgi:5-methylthioadenosine/S-adenosylhomocysteine deaminase
MSFIFADGWLITMNDRREILERGSVAVDGDRITAIGSRRQLEEQYPGAEVIYCSDRIVMPGMVNTHTHMFQTLLKGLGDDMVLKKWFTCMTGPSGVHLTAPDAHAAALHGCVESIRSGVTTVVDFMYVHPQPGMITSVVEAFQTTGMRGFVCRGFISDGVQYGVPAALLEAPPVALADAKQQIRRYNQPGGRVQVGLAPNMIWAVDEEGYRLTRKLADEEHVLITTHVAETDFELETAAATYGMNDTQFLSDIGFFGPDVIAVHCVHCKTDDIKILRQHDTKVSHNPCSNMYLASGCAPIPEMLASGVTVGLASDGPASSNNHSLFQAMKFAALQQKGVHQDATIMTAEKVLEMATIDGARAVGLEKEIGSIEVGKKADIIVIDYNNAFMTPIHHPVSAMVYSALGSEVTTVMIDGRLVMRDGIVGTVDEGTVRRQAQISADALTQRAGTDAFKRRPWPGR